MSVSDASLSNAHVSRNALALRLLTVTGYCEGILGRIVPQYIPEDGSDTARQLKELRNARVTAYGEDNLLRVSVSELAKAAECAVNNNPAGLQRYLTQWTLTLHDTVALKKMLTECQAPQPEMKPAPKPAQARANSDVKPLKLKAEWMRMMRGYEARSLNAVSVITHVSAIASVAYALAADPVLGTLGAAGSLGSYGLARTIMRSRVMNNIDTRRDYRQSVGHFPRQWLRYIY